MPAYDLIVVSYSDWGGKKSRLPLNSLYRLIMVWAETTALKDSDLIFTFGWTYALMESQPKNGSSLNIGGDKYSFLSKRKRKSSLI